MRALVQRVTKAEVRIRAAGSAVAGDLAAHPGSAAIGAGLVVLVGVGRTDSESDACQLAAKIAALRIFEDAAGKMNLPVSQTRGGVLAVSQFTLFASCRKGNRPSFEEAAPADEARGLFQRFVAELRARELPVETGVFGASMEIELVNDGPVTIWLDSRELTSGGGRG